MRTNQMMNLFLLSQLGGVGLVVDGGGSSSNIGRRRKDKANDDGTILVEDLEGQEEEEENVEVGAIDEEKNNSLSNKNNELWQYLAVTIDRIVIAIILLIYVLSFFTLVPLARLSISDPIKVEN